jgi:hypothetical protein
MPYRHVAVLMLKFKSPLVTIKFNKILVPEQLILPVSHQILPLIQMEVMMTSILVSIKSICHVRQATVRVSEQCSL